MERRISAILVADMAGFSRLSELDEQGTIERQKALRETVVEPLIDALGGRIVKLTGDGWIAEFGSAVAAVRCALDMQKENAARESGVEEARRLRYRVAVHLGDVMADEGDLYGDGVNVAARMEAFAAPDGVVISGQVHDMLKTQVRASYRYLGEKTLKNIAAPVRIYEAAAGEASPPRRRRRGAAYVGAGLAVAVVAALVWAAGFWEGSSMRGGRRPPPPSSSCRSRTSRTARRTGISRRACRRMSPPRSRGSAT